MLFQPSPHLILAMLATRPSIVGAATCGKWYSTNCMADNDKRYDPGYPNNIAIQNPLWNDLAGLWVVQEKWFHGDGSPQVPTHFDPETFSGFPYSRSEGFLSFVNVTLSGSRYYEHKYSMNSPAPQAFCDEPLESGQANVLGEGTCGANGRAMWRDQYAVASYEKDGSLRNFRATSSLLSRPSDLSGYWMINGDRTIFSQEDTYYKAGEITGGTSYSNTFQFTNSDKTTATKTELQYHISDGASDLIAYRVNRWEKVPEKEWLAKLEKTWEDYNILPEQRAGSGALPMSTDCLAGNTKDGKCPSEEDWCRVDPNCSVSPYQEPEANLDGGAIGGIVAACAVVIFALGFVYHKWKMGKRLQEQEERMKLAFVKSVAKTIPTRAIANSLSIEDMTKQFESMDADKDGTISRDELRTFLAEQGQALEDRDFEVLWNAVDTDGGGEIDFTEFVAFFSSLRGEFDKQIQRESIMMKRASARTLSTK